MNHDSDVRVRADHNDFHVGPETVSVSVIWECAQCSNPNGVTFDVERSLLREFGHYEWVGRIGGERCCVELNGDRVVCYQDTQSDMRAD
jgi:hypothetical protein